MFLFTRMVVLLTFYGYVSLNSAKYEVDLFDFHPYTVATRAKVCPFVVFVKKGKDFHLKITFTWIPFFANCVKIEYMEYV